MARGKAKVETKARKKKQETVAEAEEAGPEPVVAELEKTSPAEEAKEVAKEEAEELKEEAKAKEVKEEAKPEAAAEEEEEELEIVEEKFYDLNLRRIWTAPREKRTPRAVRFLRAYISRRMKTDDVAISEEANSMLWARGISKPPRKIRVRAVKDKEGHVIVFPGEGK